MDANLETVVKQLTDSGLIAAGKLKNFVPPQANPKTAEELVAELVKRDHLTSFQAQHVKAGKAKALILGNYTVLEMIGAGGMGQVFKAEHRRMERVVAIKMLPPAMTKNATALARFQREVKAAARLRHSNIVGADDADEANGSHFLVMEYVEGKDLSAHVKKNGPFSVDKAVNYTLQAARGLEFAHAEGVVHRDIKPGNLLLDKKGVVKILDMGLARIDAAQGDVAAQSELTGTGAIMGTVDYMAPEQGVSTHDVDARADIYSLGCTLHYLLLGKPVYEGETIGAKFLAHHRQPIPDLGALREDVPEEINAIFQKMVAKKVEDRYQTMTEVIADLQDRGVGQDDALTMQRSIGLNSDNSTLKSIRSSSLASSHRNKKTRSSGGDKKKLIYGAVGAGVFGLLVLTAIVVSLRDNGGTKVAEADRPAAVVPVAKVEAPATPPMATKPNPTAEARTSSAKIDPPVIKPSIDKPATIKAPSETTPVPVAKAEPPVAKPVVNKPAPVAAPPAKMPAPTVLAKVEPPIAKPTANVPATKAPAPAPAAKVEPVAVKVARLPIPDEAAQKKAEQLVQDLFKADLTQAKLPDQKLALAEKILAQVAVTRDDPAARYAMLQETRRLAVEIADVGILNESIDTLASGYAVNAAEMWIASLDKAGQKPRLPPINKSLAKAALDQLDRLEADDNFDLAARLQAAALAPARKARDPALLKEVVECGKNLAAARKQAESMEKTKEILAAKPDNPAANLALGRYLCFTKRAWNEGFTRLAKGSDPTLAKLASRSLANFSDPAAQIALAEDWWKSAESAKGADIAELQLGAGYCFARALPQLTGLAKTVAEQRIQSLPPKIAQELFDSAAQVWINEIAALPVEKQLEVVNQRLAQLNPGFMEGLKPRIEGGVVTELIVEGKFLADISPLRALVGLKILRCPDAKLSDISPLRGMKLDTLILFRCNALENLSPLEGMKLTTYLDIGSCPVHDISPLRGMKLKKLEIGRTRVEDLSPLKGMPLTELSVFQSVRVRDISPLQGMKLTSLNINGCLLIRDLEPLRDMPLISLSLGGPEIQDFSPLRGMKLIKLDLGGATQLQNLDLFKGMKLNFLSIENTGVTDLNPLRGMSLDDVRLTPKNITTGMDLLRTLPSLRTIGIDRNTRWPAAEFWTRYDRGEFR